MVINISSILIEHDIHLDFSTSDAQKISIKQNSKNSHVLHVYLYNYSKQIKIDSSWNITLSGEKSDNTSIISDSNISVDEINNCINVLLSEQSLSVSGTLKCELIIQDDISSLYSNTFLIYLEPNIQGGEKIESQDEFSVLSDTLKIINDYEQQAKESAEEIETTYGELTNALLKTNELVEINEKIVIEETLRVEAEKTRTSSEIERVNSEDKRIEAENNREISFTTAINNVNNATERANSLAEQIEDIISDGLSAENIKFDSTPTTLIADTVQKAIVENSLNIDDIWSVDLPKKPDYEEGTFTPIIYPTNTSTKYNGSYYIQGGNYKKIGNMVTFSANIVTASTTNVSYLGGLPFAPRQNVTAGDAYPINFVTSGSALETTGVVYGTTAHINALKSFSLSADKSLAITGYYYTD